MRKVILSMMMSADGFMEANNRDINWHVWDEEMDNYMMDFFKKVDTFLYGRVSYELMISYWPEQKGEFAKVMNDTPKIVFSNTLEKAVWNSTIFNGDIVNEINTLKKQEGKDLVLFAGADLATTFINNNLIDEYRIIVNPVSLGKGKPLFKDLKSPLKLQLINTIAFNCGNVILIYKPES